MKLVPRIERVILDRKEAEKPLPSVQEMADTLGVKRQMITNYKSGLYSPSLKRAFMLAKLLDCKVDDLFVLRDEDEQQKSDLDNNPDRQS